MSQRKTVTCPNPDVLAQAVAVRVLTTIRNLLAEPGRSRVDIALTGGTDGNRVLRAIGTDPLADDLDASRVHIWWGDERFVPEDSDDRNAKQARRFLNILVERGLMPEENIHEMPADTRDAARIAAATDEENDAVLAVQCGRRLPEGADRAAGGGAHVGHRVVRRRRMRISRRCSPAGLKC